jgi:hypothetical protein
MPPPEPKRIDALYAWVATEPDGGEGVCGADIPALGGMVPLVGADLERMRSLRPYAELTRRASGCRVRLIGFTGRLDIEELP